MSRLFIFVVLACVLFFQFVVEHRNAYALDGENTSTVSENVDYQEQQALDQQYPSIKDDYVRGAVASFFKAIYGRTGDVLVGLSIVAALLMLYRKRYKAAVGCLIIMCGVVVVRVFIGLLFDAAEL